METVVEKEIKQSPQQRMSSEGIDPSCLEVWPIFFSIQRYIKRYRVVREVLAVKHMAKKPQEKFDTPATTAQELGGCGAVATAWLEQIQVADLHEDELRELKQLEVQSRHGSRP